jgi:hypothetical protein
MSDAILSAADLPANYEWQVITTITALDGSQ